MIKISSQTKNDIKGLLETQQQISNELQAICRTVINEKGSKNKEYYLDDRNIEIIEKEGKDGD